jgi:hypothetical protein
MIIKRLAKGTVKVYLDNMPGKENLERLNALGTFEVCEKRGYKRLLQTTVNNYGISLTMECPIKEWFQV